MSLGKAGIILAGAVALNLGCTPPCTQLDRRPESVCFPPDSGAPEGQPFELSATVSNGSQISCAVSVDGGVIELTISGDYCGSAAAAGAKPAVRKSTVKCSIPALDAGQYTVPGFISSVDTVVNVGGDAGPGVPACP